ncbi:MAG: ATP-dependent helicase [Candidatus Pacebacteria bacterium]|nr:ATP-dependent helicase [Candidatus Paceibacterota bacterium]
MSTTAFDSFYAKLNAAQKQAVDTIEGPVMVIAGPGTGKTTILTLRIANILKRTDTPANGILAITYTDAGVKAMRSKLQNVIGTRAHDVQIHTFHSFAAAMIAEYPDHFLQIHEMKVMTDIEQETLIRDIVADEKFASIRPISKPDHYVPGIIKSVEESKRQAMTPEMVRQHVDREIKRIHDDPESISTRGATKGQLKADAHEQIEKCERTRLFADVYELYEERKRVAKKLDFSDLIIELLVVLRNDQLLLRLIQERFLYILVDEHQDTNDAQNFIVTLIAEFFETPNIFMVGDEKQAIYRFQGASVDNFLLLRKIWPAMKLISLDMNYRSHQGILDASFSMIENNYGVGEHEDLRVKLKSGRNKKQGGAEKNVEVVVGENVAAAEARMIVDLKRIAADDPEATVAIIVRRNRDLDRVIRLCEANGVKISSERSIDIFNHPVGSLYFDLIQYLADPSRIDALARTIISGMWNLSFGEASELVRSVKSGQADKELFESRLPGLLHVQRQMLNDSPVGFLVHAAEKSGYTSLFMRDPVYINVWRGIVALAESVVRDAKIQDPMKLMEALLAYRLSAESRMVKVTVGAPGASFQALTAHGSKGLEFDYVFIPYATDEAWIGKPRGSSFVLPRKESGQNDVHDVRRLFYVALTRAREKATVLTALEESDGKQLTPLRFIAELDEVHTFTSEIPRVDAASVLSSDVGQKVSVEGVSNAVSARSIRDQSVVDIAQRVLLEKGLSVTALNHYLKCPNTFLYQSILRVPQAPSVSADKGTAMHEAISAVWRSDIFSISDGRERVQRIQTILAEALNEYFKTSFLPLSEKEAVKKELLANAPAVADALEPHFMLKGDRDVIYAEHWVKTSFVGTFAGTQVLIPIHGKLDAILDRSDEVSVFDYKTKQAMSINAIKGETKSSDGGYFRQLIFYKLLMSDEPKWRQKKILPALVFVSPDEKGRCPTVSIPIGPDDVERVKKEIQSLIDAVWSGSIVGTKCDDEKCEWCGLAGI